MLVRGAPPKRMASTAVAQRPRGVLSSPISLLSPKRHVAPAAFATSLPTVGTCPAFVTSRPAWSLSQPISAARYTCPQGARATARGAIQRLAAASDATDPTAVGNGQDSQPPFFDRVKEKGNLVQLCSGCRPASIIVVLGPRNSGKTRLLEHVKDALDAEGVPVSLLNCRLVARPNGDVLSAFLVSDVARKLVEKSPVQSSAALTAGLQAMLSKALVTFELPAGKVQLSPFAGLAPGSATAAAFSTSGQYPPVDDTFDTCKVMLQKNKATPGAKLPVIIMDEANELMNWSEEGKKDLQRLLRFLVAITKEANQAHVVLASSQSSFRDWIAAGTQGNTQVLVVGDLIREDARAYLESHFSPGMHAIDEQTWTKVYEVCGGNAGLLSLAASNFTVHKDWAKALAGIEINARMLVEDGFDGGPGWSREQYAAAVLAILDNPHHAVCRRELEGQLGRGSCGAAALKAMVNANLLELRPPSDLAADIPQEAYKTGQMVVTAATPAQLYAMKRMREDFETARPAQG